jgi:membrane protease YdiL (CAAX protease family)
VVLVGLTFGLFHGMQYAGVPAALVAVTAMGLATTWVRMATGGILPCIVLHAAYNAVGVALLLVTESLG